MKERFESLDIPVYVSVTNLNEGKSEFINKGDIVPYCIASASVFPIFKPLTIDDKHFIDGGFMANISIKPLEKYKVTIICVNL